MQWSGGKSTLLKRSERADDAGTSGRLFGIRSYLHSFYTSADPEEEDEGEGDDDDGGNESKASVKVKQKAYDFVADDEDDEEEDDDDDENDECVDGRPSNDASTSGLSAISGKCRKLQRSGRRTLRKSVRKASEYVHQLRDRLVEIGEKRGISHCCAWLNQIMISIAIACLLVALIGLIVVCSVSGESPETRQQNSELISSTSNKQANTNT